MPVVPARTIDCWSCDTPNTPSRLFCVGCGSFIAIGSQTTAAPQAEPFSGPPTVPGDPDVDVSLPLIEGVAPLGSYSVEAQKRATRRTRTITAVTSIALAMVIGGAALYLASPLGDRAGAPELAAAGPAATEPASIDDLDGIDADDGDSTDVVSGLSVKPQAVPAEPVIEEESVAESEPEPIAEPEPIVEPEPAEPIEGGTEPATEPVVEAEPADAVAAAEPVEPAELVEPAEAVEMGEPELRPVDDGDAGYAGGWVCNKEVTIDDSRVRDWSIGSVTFRRRAGFERVVLELQRAGRGNGDEPGITADAMGSWKVEEDVSGAGRPGVGRRSVVLQLEGGFTGSPILRRYRPSGLDIIKEFSIYRAGRDGRNVVISADTGGCYRLRVPAWDDPSASVRRAEIQIDIRP